MNSKTLTTKLIASLAMLLISTISIAQQGINYQGVARDADQQLITDTEITLEININKAAVAGETVYTETHTVTTDTNGVFSVVIGQGTTASEFTDINWAEDMHYLNVWLNNVEIGTTEFKSVPYTQAMGKWQAHMNGLMPVGTGNSIYIGEKAGENENLNSVNNNIGLGLFALQSNSGGYNNIALGSEALKLNASGINNTAMGNRALYSNTTGNHNLAIGLDAMESNSTGSNNIAIGEQAMQNNEEGNDNVANGFSALNANTTGNNNTANGNSALLNNTSGNNNIASGFESLYSNTSGNDNVALGFLSLHENTEGNGNIALGNRSLKLNTSGSNNIALGVNAMESNTIGYANIAMGSSTLKDNTTGIHNIAMGINALESNTIGYFNFAAGASALQSNSEGLKNIAIGSSTLQNNTNGESNIALGSNSLFFNDTGDHNIAIGIESLIDNVSGESNIGIGFSALQSNIDDLNIAIGKTALYNHATGSQNLALGHSALFSHQTGSFNTALGSRALKDNVSGDFNVAIGYRAGSQNLGERNVFIGSYSGTHSDYDNVSNTLIIDVTGSNTPLIYGHFYDEILGFNAKVGIGTDTPAVPLHITFGSDVDLTNGSGVFVIGNESTHNLAMDSNEIQARNNGNASDLYLQSEGGNVRVGGAVVHASDKRLKRDINDISYGLQEVLKLRPTEYFWKGKTQEHKSLGLIAQEVDKIIKNVVTYDKEQDKYGVSYTELIPVLIKAIQEQEKAIKKLEEEVAELKLSTK